VVAAITIGIKLRASKTFLDIDTFRRAAVAYTPLQRCWRHPNPRSLSLNTPRDLEMTRVDLGEVMAFGGQG
jgi:hypothetical protein